MPEFWTWRIENGPTMCDAVAERELAGDDVLRHLVGDKGRDRDRAQAPATAAGVAPNERRAARRRQGVRRRADSDLELPATGSLTLCSAFRLQSMQSDAQGSPRAAPRRSGWPQDAHMPYVPSSIRFSAASISVRTSSALSSSV